MITDTDARLIAQHIVRIMRKELIAVALQTKQQVIEEETDEIFTSQQAADFLRISINTLRKHLHEIPHRQKGKGHQLIFYRKELLTYTKHI